MNKEAINILIEKNPSLKSKRHALEKLQVGTYCIHRSWGFGEIKSYNEGNNKLVIDFEEGKEGHAMDPVFCINKLEILDKDHLLARQKQEPEAMAEKIKKEPVEIVIEVLSTNAEGIVSSIELEGTLMRLVGKTKFKKWWTNTKKLLIKDPRVGVPVKKNDPYILRDEPLTPEQEVLEEFYAIKHPKKKILLAEKLYQLSESVESIASDLPRILDDLTDAVKNARQLNQADRLHGIWIRNDLGRYLCEDVEKMEPTSTSLIKETENLSELSEQLPSNYYKRFLDLISRVYPDDWNEVVLNLLKNSMGKFTSECIGFLMERDYADLIEESFKRWLDEQALKGPVLYWMVRNRNTRRFQKLVKDLVGYRLFNSILVAIDNEALTSTGNRRIMLADFLHEDFELISDLLSDASPEIARDLAHRLILNQGFDELSRKSLLARFIKQFPSIQSLVAGDVERDAGDLIVSKESLEYRKQEYELLVNKKIPENKEAIAEAREHGDLRENAEYKMARQEQDMLHARKSLLEQELGRARVTDFKDANDDEVSIGSIVEVEEGSTKKVHTYAILGAWDSNPEENILSYKTPLGQSLLSKKVGDSVKTQIGNNEETWSIRKISRWVDQKNMRKEKAS